MNNLNQFKHSHVSAMETDKPYLRIIEQPVRIFRYRFDTETRRGTHGCINGIGSTKLNRTFPTIQLINFTGDATIRCSLSQIDALTSVPHPYSLVVRKGNGYVKDPHDVEVSYAKGYTVTFEGMGIIGKAKKFNVEELHKKLVHRMSSEKRRDLTPRETLQAENVAKHINMHKVCLRFEAFDKNWITICDPVLSTPIDNERNAKHGNLKIMRLSTNISDANGGEDVYLFVGKVGKDNIKVRFFQMDEKEELIWEDWGRFSATDVHYQYAIALRTPPYQEKYIEETVNCFIQLFRPSDQCYSDAMPFRYKPSAATVSRKRARITTPYNSTELPTISDENRNLSDEDFENFLKSFSANLNTEELETLIDPVELLDSNEVIKELQIINENML